MTLKQSLKLLLPPIALPAARRLAAVLRREAPDWRYVPEGWRADDPRGSGWHHPSVAAMQRRRWPDFVAAVEGAKPLGVTHEAVRIDSENPAAQSTLLVLLYAMARAAAGRSRLAVLDWGGGLGYHAVMARAALPEIAFDYTVKELPDICAAGRELLPEVRFVSDEETCFAGRYDLVFAGNAIHYTRDWPSLLARFGAAAPWVLLATVPLVRRARTFALVQRPRWVGYDTEYISWVFNRDEFMAETAAHGLTLEREFLSAAERPTVLGAPEAPELRDFLFCAGGGASPD